MQVLQFLSLYILVSPLVFGFTTIGKTIVYYTCYRSSTWWNRTVGKAVLVYDINRTSLKIRKLSAVPTPTEPPPNLAVKLRVVPYWYEWNYLF
jgi:hypothetical protein